MTAHPDLTPKQRGVDCSQCSGESMVADNIDCLHCKNTGYEPLAPQQASDITDEELTRECRTCGGHGKLRDFGGGSNADIVRCHICKGTGRVAV
jgi:DnaJ-class molecular chaperone